VKALDDIWNDRLYREDISFTDNIGLMLQPSSFTDFHSHPDFAEAYRLFTQNDPFRGLDFARIWSVVLNAKQALTKCAGSLAELGVYQGQSSALLSFYAKQFERKIYLLDTFEGFAEQQYEEGMGEGKQAAFKDVSLESAHAVVGGYEGNRWVVGMFPNSTTEEMRSDTYAFVSIDCDIYEPIIEGLKFFWPRMSAGGMIFIHDYSSGHWPGATRAVDEFCKQNAVAGCLLPDYAGSYVLTRTSAGAEPDRGGSFGNRGPRRGAELQVGAARTRVNGDGAAVAHLQNPVIERAEEVEKAPGETARLANARDRRHNPSLWRVARPLRIVRAVLEMSKAMGGGSSRPRPFGDLPQGMEASRGGNLFDSGSEGSTRASKDNAVSEIWSPDTIKGATFRPKLNEVPDVIADWVREHRELSGGDVLDFGCGEATAALGIALRYGARRVVGIEIHEELNDVVPYGESQLELDRLPENLEFIQLDALSPLDSLGMFDLVYSWSVFQNVGQSLMVDCFSKIKRVLRPDGVMFLQTAPLYYSAEGSNLKPWIPAPWAHLIMQRDLFYAALRQSAGSREQADQLQRVYETLNRVTAPQLLRAARQAGFEVIKEYRTYDEITPPDELKEIFRQEVLTTNQLVFIARHASSSPE
jgi:cyclopropane fatty-acyl-phospholipid synthase-like methyltransferase